MPYVRHLMPLFGQCHYAVEGGPRAAEGRHAADTLLCSPFRSLSLSFCYSALSLFNAVAA